MMGNKGSTASSANEDAVEVTVGNVADFKEGE